MTEAISCIGRCLDNTSLSPLLIGLDAETGYGLKESSFPCCHGTGFLDRKQKVEHAQSQSVSYIGDPVIHRFIRSLVPHAVQELESRPLLHKPVREDSISSAVQVCPIRARLKRTRDLIKIFYQYWGELPLPYPEAAQTPALLTEISDVLGGKSTQARTYKGQAGKPGAIWSVALALAWRFGVEVHMVSFAKKGKTITLPSKEIMTSDRPLAIVVEQVSKLTDPGEISQLEALISLSYQSNAFLWLEVMVARNAPTKGGESLMQKKGRDLANSLRPVSVTEILKGRLSPSAFSQLQSLLSSPRPKASTN